VVRRVRLYDIGHSRAGDKGNTSIVSFFVYEANDYEPVRRALTAERVKAHFGTLVGAVRRYEVPSLGALNFVMEDALAGGVTTSLAIDPHGKSRSSLLLAMELDIEESGGGPSTSSG
jgi:hypothetical protein